MATTQKELESWFNEGVKNGATHMIIVCDTYDWTDYPAYIYPAEDVRKEAQIWGGKRVFNY
jgi:hypothetical protein